MTNTAAFRDLCTVLAAHRLDLVRIAGRLAARSAEMSWESAGPTVNRWAEETAEDARSIAAGVEALTRHADDLLEDTNVEGIRLEDLDDGG